MKNPKNPKETKETKGFTFLPIGEAVNNLDYYRGLLQSPFFKDQGLTLEPISCWLKPVNYGGDVKTMWNKETTASYKVSFLPVDEGIECVAIDQTNKLSPDLTMVRLLTDFPFDLISHVLTYTQRDKSGKKVFVIFKPFADGAYKSCKLNTQKRYADKYNKVFGITAPAK